jgi:hypothetical protein
MDNQNDLLSASTVQPETNSNGSPSRRGFLGSIGAISLATMAGVLAPISAGGTTSEGSAPGRLASLAKLNLTREESFDVPGGKEVFLEWQAGDEKGVVQKFIVHHTRQDADVTYTMNTNVIVRTYGPGMDLQGKPASAKEQNVTVYGVKGEIVGSVRNDHVTITTVHQDGRTSRQSQVAQVRLESPEFAGTDTAAQIASIGRRFLGQSQ